MPKNAYSISLPEPYRPGYVILTNALVTYGGQLVPLLWHRLQGLMEEVGEEHWRIGGTKPSHASTSVRRGGLIDRIKANTKLRW